MLSKQYHSLHVPNVCAKATLYHVISISMLISTSISMPYSYIHIAESRECMHTKVPPWAMLLPFKIAPFTPGHLEKRLQCSSSALLGDDTIQSPLYSCPYRSRAYTAAGLEVWMTYQNSPSIHLNHNALGPKSWACSNCHFCFMLLLYGQPKWTNVELGEIPWTWSHLCDYGYWPKSLLLRLWPWGTPTNQVLLMTEIRGTSWLVVFPIILQCFIHRRWCRMPWTVCWLWAC